LRFLASTNPADVLLKTRVEPCKLVYAGLSSRKKRGAGVLAHVAEHMSM
jgi:hypothetical protein